MSCDGHIIVIDGQRGDNERALADVSVLRMEWVGL